MSIHSEIILSETVLARLQTLENQLADNQADLQQTQIKLEHTQAELNETKSYLATSAKQMQRTTRRCQVGGATALIAVTACLLTLSRPAAMAQAGVTLSSLLARVVALETKTAAITQSGTPGTSSAKLTITGDNIQIVSGSGYTDDGTQGEISGAKLTGLGNLIIGYSEAGNILGHGDVRTGSHNLILGDCNNYSSFGGLVAGSQNSISGQYAFVSGGYINTASGFEASVSGGFNNTASGICSSVSGGSGNLASNDESSVSGGLSNTASGIYSSVSGGSNNLASIGFSSVSGGQFNKASGYYSSVTGGDDNVASDSYASVTGGQQNTASNNFSSVSGGNSVTQSNASGWSGGSYHSP